MRSSSISLPLWLALLPALSLCQDPPPPPMAGFQTSGYVITPSQLIKIDPLTQSCDNTAAQYVLECAPAAAAAGPISTMFQLYQISAPAQKAAVLSLMLFETGGFRYNRNHFPAPGNPGQGTRNMQKPEFNAEYATYMAEKGFLHPEDVNAAKGKNDGGKAVLDLLLPVGNSTMDFGSGAWFFSTKCSNGVKDGLAKNAAGSWESYLTDCVGTTVTDDRRKLWDAASKVFGVSDSASAAASTDSSTIPSSSPSSAANTVSPSPIVASTMITQPIPAASTAPAAQTSPAASSSNGSGTTDTCSADGAIVCNGDGSKFGICKDGKVALWQAVSLGTKCAGGSIGYA